jgi:hypothetical protein
MAAPSGASLVSGHGFSRADRRPSTILYPNSGSRRFSAAIRFPTNLGFAIDDHPLNTA